MLDSSYFPAKYGFFSILELTDTTPDDLQQHIIIGQDVLGDMDLKTPVYPLIFAGEFDFADETVREQLAALAANENGGIKKRLP